MHSLSFRKLGLLLTEHKLQVPLDHAAPNGERIEVFARSVMYADKAKNELPWLVFLQGGPGFEAPRPDGPNSPAWLGRALQDYRVLLLDQRGVGRSSPIGPDDALSFKPQVLADRLALYRADAIVLDAECFRQALDVRQWSVLGQSFGGFCALAYLSAFPESLREVFITGGLPPLQRGIDEVYRQTYRSTIEKTVRHYARFPEDLARMSQLIEMVCAKDIRLPGGDRLTATRLRQLGALLGTGTGSERLHYILELPPGSPGFLHDVERASSFARNPLYAVIHESCYASGIRTDWAAQRMMPADYQADPTLLTGEHIYPWMFEDFGALAPFRQAAHLLAQRQWPRLYDPLVLAANCVPCAAAVYVDDMYVPFLDSQETARTVRGMRAWITNEYEHDGLNAGGTKVLDRLIGLTRGTL